MPLNLLNVINIDLEKQIQDEFAFEGILLLNSSKTNSQTKL